MTPQRNCAIDDSVEIQARGRPSAITRSCSSAAVCETDEQRREMFRWARAHRHLSRNGFRSRQRRNAAYRRCTRRQRRCRDKEGVSLPRRRTIWICGGIARHAHACKGSAVGKRSCEPVRERLEEGNDLVLLRIGQAEHTNRRVKVVGNLGVWPAVYLLNRSCRAVPGSDVVVK